MRSTSAIFMSHTEAIVSTVNFIRSCEERMEAKGVKDSIDYQLAPALVISCIGMCGMGYQPALKHVGQKLLLLPTEVCLKCSIEHTLCSVSFIEQLKHSLWSIKYCQPKSVFYNIFVSLFPLISPTQASYKYIEYVLDKALPQVLYGKYRPLKHSVTLTRK